MSEINITVGLIFQVAPTLQQLNFSNVSQRFQSQTY